MLASEVVRDPGFRRITDTLAIKASSTSKIETHSKHPYKVGLETKVTSSSNATSKTRLASYTSLGSEGDYYRPKKNRIQLDIHNEIEEYDNQFYGSHNYAQEMKSVVESHDKTTRRKDSFASNTKIAGDLKFGDILNQHEFAEFLRQTANKCQSPSKHYSMQAIIEHCEYKLNDCPPNHYEEEVNNINIDAPNIKIGTISTGSACSNEQDMASSTNELRDESELTGIDEVDPTPFLDFKYRTIVAKGSPEFRQPKSTRNIKRSSSRLLKVLQM